MEKLIPTDPNDITWFIAFIVVLVLMGGGFFRLLWVIIKSFVDKVEELIQRQENDKMEQIETNKSLIDAIQKLTIMVEVHEVKINHIDDTKGKKK